MQREFIILLTFITASAYGQASSDSITYDLSARFLYSSIWTGRVGLQPFTQDHPWSFQVDMGIVKNTQRSWNYCNCYTRNGISISYINFNNPAKLGNAVTFSFFTEPMLLLRNRFSISYRGSAGFALLSKLYDSVVNKEPIFFSTKLSYYLAMGLKTTYRFGNKISISASGQVNHISNAGRRDPNEGMNFPSVNMEVSYVINPIKLERRNRTKFKDKSWELMTHGFGAFRRAQATTKWMEETRFVGGVNAGLIRRLGRLNGIGGGAEFYYDGINSVFQNRTGETIQTLVGGAGIQHYLFLGKLLFGQQFLWFMTPNTGYQRNNYQRYFLEYEVKKHWYAGVSLKAHGDHSDYLALSVSRRIKL